MLILFWLLFVIIIRGSDNILSLAYINLTIIEIDNSNNSIELEKKEQTSLRKKILRIN